MAGPSLRNLLQLAIAALIAMVVLHTWLVLGLIVPVTVSGSSMAPALLGPHRMYGCPSCAHEFPVGMDQLPLGDMAVCPECGERRATATAGSNQPGQRLMIDRTAFALRAPERWEVVVFRCPENPRDLCVKRVVGLPGETVTLDGGDVLIDGVIARKGLAQQRMLRRLVHPPSEQPTTRPVGIDGVTIDAPSRWQPGESQRLEYRNLGSGFILDDFSYNQCQVPPLNRSDDVMLTFAARLAGQGRLVVAAQQHATRWEVAIDFGRDVVRLQRDGELLMEQPVPAQANTARFAEWTFSWFDRQVLAAINGRVVLSKPWETDQVSHPADASAERPPLFSLGVDDVAGEIRTLAVWQDIHYAVRHRDGRQPGAQRGAATSWRLGPTEFFVVGDNAAISDDSRSWLSGPGVDAKLLIGSPLELP